MGWIKPPASCEGGGSKVMVCSIVEAFGGFVDGGADQEGEGGRSMATFWPAEAAQIGESSSILLG